MIRKTKLAAASALLPLICALWPASTLAQSSLERGETLAYTCLGCHGIEGYRNAYPSYRVPRLGGQKAAYIVAAVQGYRDGLRAHSTMTAQAASLSDQDIDDIATYLASIGNQTVAAGGTANADLQQAATCVACHGQNGISVSPAWPSLAGQHEEYLVESLNQYRNGSRKDPVMSQIAAPLTDADVKILARYYSGLKGLETTLPQ